MKNLLTVLLTCFLTTTLCAQQYDVEKVDKRAYALFEQGIAKAEAGYYKDAIAFFQKALEIDKNFVDARLSIAGVYGQMKNYPLSIENYEKARAMDTVYFRELNLPYSINLAGNGNFDKALAAVEAFLSIPRLNEKSRLSGEFRKRCYAFAIAYAKQYPNPNYVFAPKNMGDSINTKVSEYFPSLTIDGSRLVYTRRVGDANEDFFESKRHNNNWSKSAPLEGNINTAQNEGAQNISQDGQWLVFTGCNFPRSFGSCDLYFSLLTRQGWSNPENLGGRINTDGWESQPCFSPDKRELYFAARRPDCIGGSDIYVSRLQANGRWSEPENMGPGINTSGNESCPFIHADNQTLYFTSNGWPGYGGDDLFISRRGNDGKWGTPLNLGFPINTIENEGSFIVSADGRTAYYASDRSDSRGGLDLYSFELRNDIRPNKTLWIKGVVFDKKTKQGIPSAVELTDLNSKQTISKVQTDELGNYMITLPVGKAYAFNVNRKGYLLYSDGYDLTKSSPDSVYQKDIPLQPIEMNASIVLKNVFFDFKKFELKPASQVELDKLVQLLKDNPTVNIRINGHTDNIGKPADNLLLSAKRAQVVMLYLIEKGIGVKRLSAKGFGATKPVSENKTEAGRALNRRTEIEVTGIK
jgi:outer membrane protein OmpA-like peptidoglycan-associated protein/tetratricopeptide (TPR) repeat protein